MNNFKELRKEKGLTQFELAKIMNIDQTTVSKWELGKAIPDTNMLIKLAEFFDVSTDYLLSRTNFYYPDNLEENQKKDKLEIGNLIKELRQNKGLTQQEVADKISISRSVLSQYENNLVEPTATVISKLAVFFEVPAGYLLCIEDDFGNLTTSPMREEGATEQERELLKNFRKLSPYLKEIALNTVQGLTGAKNDDLHKRA